MPLRILAVAHLTATLSIASPAAAGSFEVAPTTVEMRPASPAAILQVTNHNDHDTAFQIEAFAWRQDAGKDALVPTTALQASPPIAQLRPGERQTVRLRHFGAPGPREQAYRLLVTELPAAGARDGQAVRVLLQFSVPVFFGGAGRAPADLRWRMDRDGADLVITAENAGDTRIKLSDPAISENVGSMPLPGDSLTYVLAGGRRAWRVPASAVRRDAPLRVTAVEDDIGSRVAFAVHPGE